jgi:lysozyme
VVVGVVWTQEQSGEALTNDMHWAANVVSNLCHISLTQGKFDALVDFTYNVVAGSFANSTMLKLLNSGQVQEAAEQFDLWDKAGGKVVAGLLRRRKLRQ